MSLRATDNHTTAPLRSRGRVPSKSVPKADPVIDMIAWADKLLNEYIEATNNLHLAKAKLSQNDRRSPSVVPPEGLRFDGSEWNWNFRFTSEKHIESEFRRITKRLKDEIKDARGSKKSISQLSPESKARIFRNRTVLALLPKYKEPLKRELRTEQRRLAKVQKKVGLQECHKKRNAASFALHAITEQIAKTKPTTTRGALAMVDYARIRLRSDLAEVFSDNGDMPARFSEVLRSVHGLLRRSI
jgi:hypothetical protein